MEMQAMTVEAVALPESAPHAEEALVLAASQGDDRAFEAIVTTYQQRVRRQCQRRGLSPDEAADVSQDVFIKVYRGLERYNHQNTFSTWLYRVTENACIDYCRQRQRRWAVIQPIGTDESGQEMDFAGPIADPEGQHNAEELGARIMAALESLTPMLRTAFEMKELEGLRYEEIATRLGVTLGTVKSRIFRARQILIEQLQDLA
jgi:RNA polymerase sigma-70 factor, ECF subfamily